MADNPRIDELRRRLDKDPASRLFAQLAEELRKNGDLDEAIRVARGGLGHHPNYPSARMTLGHALMDTGDLRAARVEFETVLRGAPDNILASRYLGESLEGLGDLGSALLQYRATLRLAPGDKNIEGLIRTLEERLSAPSPRAPSAPTSAPPTPPAPPATTAVAARPPEAAPIAATASESAPSDASRTVAPPAVATVPPTPAPSPTADVPPAAVALATEEPLVVEENFDLEAPFVAPGGGWTATEPARFVADLEERVRLTPEPEPPASAAAFPGTAPRMPEPGPPAPAVSPPPTPAEAPALSSSTLAELYYHQGFPEKAMEVYRELIGREPDNERARERLREIAAVAGKPGESAAGAAEPRAARRRAIERTIERLEGLLAAIREVGG